VGYSRIHMLYRYGTSNMGVILNSGRMLEAFRSPRLEFAVSQCTHMEGDAQFSDIILPACTSLERWDISESANAGGVLPLGHYQNNHRIFLLQQKAMEPMGESKSDYQIFVDILERVGGAGMFTEGGNTELAWCKRVFDSSDLPKMISWKEFMKKGYYVLPPIPKEMDYPVEMRWFAEGRAKDTPEVTSLPGQSTDTIGQGLGTPSSKFEFVPKSLAMIEAEDPDRPAVNRYIPSWEGQHTKELVGKFPLQLLTAHPPFSFHTQADGKNSTINSIKDHRIWVDGHAYWIIRLGQEEAARRGLVQHDLVKVYNDRGAVICAVDISPLMMSGVAKSYGSAAELNLLTTPEGMVDRGGCMNLLTNTRQISKTSDGIAPNSCLVQIKKWDRVILKEVA
jgi:trimethylamine-N-oxide reductase (cytochrome c)